MFSADSESAHRWYIDEHKSRLVWIVILELLAKSVFGSWSSLPYICMRSELKQSESLFWGQIATTDSLVQGVSERYCKLHNYLIDKTRFRSWLLAHLTYHTGKRLGKLDAPTARVAQRKLCKREKSHALPRISSLQGWHWKDFVKVYLHISPCSPCPCPLIWLCNIALYAQKKKTVQRII